MSLRRSRCLRLQSAYTHSRYSLLPTLRHAQPFTALTTSARHCIPISPLSAFPLISRSYASPFSPTKNFPRSSFMSSKYASTSRSSVLKSSVCTQISVKPISVRVDLMVDGCVQGPPRLGGPANEGMISRTEGIQPGEVQLVKPVRPEGRSVRWVSVRALGNGVEWGWSV